MEGFEKLEQVKLKILKEIFRLKEKSKRGQYQEEKLVWLIHSCKLFGSFHNSPELIQKYQRLLNRWYDYEDKPDEKSRREIARIESELKIVEKEMKNEKETLDKMYEDAPTSLPLWSLVTPEEQEEITPRRMITKSEGKTEELIHIFDDHGGWVFRDQYNTPFVYLPPGINSPIESENLEAWLRQKHGEKSLSDQQLKNVKGSLKGRAFSEGSPVYTLYTRVAIIRKSEEFERSPWLFWGSTGMDPEPWIIYYDLGDGRAVRITSEDWSIVVRPPILFRRFSHQHPQVEPKRRKGADYLVEDVFKLLDFVNLPRLPWKKIPSGEIKVYSDQEALFLVWFIAAFIPGFPHPFLAIHGPQGSAKSTMIRVIKELLDPSAIQTLSLTTPDNFVLQAHSHWFIPLDNLSHISGEMSDLLSRACTGDGISKRKLYTDGDEFILSFQRVIGLNGITLVTAAADLLDRAILFNLDRVRGDRRQTEKDIWKNFEKMKPYILCGVFDVLVGVLDDLEEREKNEREGRTNKDLPADLSRMADFHLYGLKIAEWLGLRKEFERGYRSAIRQQNDEAIDANPLAQVVISFMKDKTFWQGSPTECLNELKNEAEKMGIDTKSKYWPKDSSALSRRLEKAKTNLETIGIRMERSKKGERLINLTKVPLKPEDETNNDHTTH